MRNLFKCMFKIHSNELHKYRPIFRNSSVRGMCVCNVHEGADKTERECESEHEVSRDVIAQIIAA